MDHLAPAFAGDGDAWKLTLRPDGTPGHELAAASPFLRQWIYGDEGRLAAKTGTIDFYSWYRRAFGRHSPWGDQDSPALCTQIETALERHLSVEFMRAGARPAVRRVRAGDTVVRQGEVGHDLFLVLDGVVRVEVDGARVAEYGPGSMHGERAALEGGTRTSTVVAVTDCKLAVARAEQLGRDALVELSAGHRREGGA